MAGTPPSVPVIFPRPKIPIQLASQRCTDAAQPEVVRVELKQRQFGEGFSNIKSGLVMHWVYLCCMGPEHTAANSITLKWLAGLLPCWDHLRFDCIDFPLTFNSIRLMRVKYVRVRKPQSCRRVMSSSVIQWMGGGSPPTTITGREGVCCLSVSLGRFSESQQRWMLPPLLYLCPVALSLHTCSLAGKSCGPVLLWLFFHQRSMKSWFCWLEESNKGKWSPASLVCVWNHIKWTSCSLSTGLSVVSYQKR